MATLFADGKKVYIEGSNSFISFTSEIAANRFIVSFYSGHSFSILRNNSKAGEYFLCSDRHLGKVSLKSVLTFFNQSDIKECFTRTDVNSNNDSGFWVCSFVSRGY